MRNVLFAFLTSLAVASPVAADQGGHDRSADTKPMSAPQDDHSFAMRMGQHHRDAIRMANHEIKNGSNAEVKAIAKRIKAQQEKELATLDAHKPANEGAHHGSMPPNDPDMARRMAALEAATGAKADSLFLQLMIVHHASALVMAQGALDKLQDSELRKLAQNAIAIQAREIGDMQRLRDGKRFARRAR
jgi:uncharacterized protein (DUF305 family)